MKQTIYIHNYETIWLPSVEPEYTINLTDLELESCSPFKVVAFLRNLLNVRVPEVYEDYKHADRDVILNKIKDNLKNGNQAAFATNFVIDGLLIDAGEYQDAMRDNDEYHQAESPLEASLEVMRYLYNNIHSILNGRDKIVVLDNLLVDGVDYKDRDFINRDTRIEAFKQCESNLNYWKGEYSLQAFAIGDLIAGEWKPYSGDDIKVTLSEIELKVSSYRLRDSTSKSILESTMSLLSGED